MSLAKKLISLRKQYGLTQMELAEKLNVSRQAISRWEVGAAAPSTDNLKILSELYGVPVDEILKGEISADSQNPELPDLPENEGNNRSKKKTVFISLCVLLTLVAAIVVAATLLHEDEETTNLPMDNMIAEEEDGIAGTFSFD